MDQTTWDAAVVGGGAAGLSAALVLGRARKRTLVIDAGEPSNAPAHAIGGLLGHDGRAPAELYARGREELTRYPSVELRTDRVVAGRPGFELDLETGTTVSARRVVLATGMEYRRPDIPGLAELWGDTVFHCPFCHGWELRDQPLAVLGEPELVDLLGAWSDDVVHIDRPIARLKAHDGKLAAIVFEDGEELARKGLLVGLTYHPRTELAEQLGDDGVYLAGDVTQQPPSVANAIASGHLAAAMLVREAQAATATARA